MVLALGEAYAYTNGKDERVTDGGGQDVAFESTYYKEVSPTIESGDDSPDLRRAQILLLAGYYNNLIACTEKSATLFARAAILLRHLLDDHKLLFQETLDKLLTQRGIDVVSDEEGALKIFEERNRDSQKKIEVNTHSSIVLAAWTCLRLLRNLFPESYKETTGLWEIEDLLPSLLLFPGENVCHGELLIQTDGRTDDNVTISYFYQALTFAERLFAQVRAEVSRKDDRTLSRQALRISLERCREDINKWREILPDHLRWDEQSALPSKSLQAQLKEFYQNTMCDIDKCLQEEPSD